MSTNKFKVGDKVKALSTGRTESYGIAGQKFKVDRVEPDTYSGPLPVRVSKEDGTYFWLGCEDIKLRGKKKKLKVGDKVIVKVQSSSNFFPVGTEGIVASIDTSAPEYNVEALGDYWYYNREQLKRVKKEKPAEAAAPKRDIKAELAAAWPWPEGTPVRLSESGDYAHRADLTGLTLGSDGSRLPPVRDANGYLVHFVEVTDVELATAYQTWYAACSRIVSSLTEEQRTGALHQGDDGGEMTMTITHSRDGKGSPVAWFYQDGDYRDNGDGTGTVLTLEEIFLNSLQK